MKRGGGIKDGLKSGLKFGIGSFVVVFLILFIFLISIIKVDTNKAAIFSAKVAGGIAAIFFIMRLLDGVMEKKYILKQTV